MKNLKRWMLGAVAAFVLAGATIPASAQVVVRVDPHHHHYHHHHYHHRHYR